MTRLVNRKFAEWTEGLSPRESMIAIFERVRDIPYALIPGLNDPGSGPEELLETGQGSCTPKHYLLTAMYRRLNLPVVFATFPFMWNDPDIQYPPELRELAKKLPVAYHLACRVQIGCRWVLVDATWDRPLKKAGFPVNEHWDGYSDMKCAVKPLKAPVRTAYCRTLACEPCRDGDEAELNPLDGEKNHWEAEDRHRYFTRITSVRILKDLEQQERFYTGLNTWLESIRQAG
jgi:hypothetical protein